MQKIAIVVIGILGLMGTQARAADMAVKAPLPAPPPVSDWSGVYVGLEGGYGWGKQNTNAISSGDPFTAAITEPPPTGTLVLTPPLVFPDVALPSIKQRGWLAGGFLGAQKQWGNWVLGIEGDIDGADIKGSGTSNASFSASSLARFTNGQTTFFTICAGPCFTLNQNLSISSKIDALASLRGKVGWSFSPNWLIYGTGGAGFAHVENAVVSTGTATISPSLLGGVCAPGNCNFLTNSLSNTSGGTTLYGWAAGGGIDWKLPLNAGSALVFGVEYLHYGFPEQWITISNNAGAIRAFRATEDVDAVKGRIGYLFSIY
jgi:outer membrane immunogenic protein